MNCQTTRETLELARPDAPDAATVAEAEQHFSACGACRAAVREREEVDVRIGALCRDVPIPVGLKDRLLAELEARKRSDLAGESAVAASHAVVMNVSLLSSALSMTMPAASTASAVRGVGSRRRWLGIASLTVALGVAVGIGTWSVWPAHPSVDLEEIAGVIATPGLDPANLTAFTNFAGGLEPQPPSTMIASPLVPPPRRLGRLEAAVYFFTLRGNRGPLEGRLAVIPRRFVKAGGLPAATSFLSGPITYRPGFCTTVWVEGKFVYICCLSGDGNELHKLVRPRPQPA